MSPTKLSRLSLILLIDFFETGTNALSASTSVGAFCTLVGLSMPLKPWLNDWLPCLDNAKLWLVLAVVAFTLKLVKLPVGENNLFL